MAMKRPTMSFDELYVIAIFIAFLLLITGVAGVLPKF